LTFIVAVTGIVVTFRTFAGPFTLVIPVNSPLNAESFFGISVTLLMLTRVGFSRSRGASGAHWPAVAAAVALVGGICVTMLARSESVAFLSDDFILTQLASQWTTENLRVLFTTGGGDGFYRPVGAVSLLIDARWASFDPVLWHRSALALHTVNAVLVTLLAARLDASLWSAVFAGVLFAIHGTRPEAAVWIAGRFDLLATLFALGAILLFIEGCERGGRSRYFAHGTALILLILAVMSKESAYIAPLLMALYVASRLPKQGCGIRSLIPFFLAAGLVFAYRWSLFSGIGGYVVSETGRPQAFSLGLLTTLKAVALRLWAILYFPINWSVDPTPALGFLCVLYMTLLLWLAVQTRPTRQLLLPLSFLLVAIIPALPLLLIGTSLGNSRVLYLPSVGFCIFLALAVDGLTGRARYLIPTVIAAFHAGVLHHNLNVWDYASAKVQSACSAAADAARSSKTLAVLGLPGEIRGVPAFSNGFRECVELRAGHPVAIERIGKTGGAPIAKNAVRLEWDKANDRLVRLNQSVGE